MFKKMILIALPIFMFAGVYLTPFEYDNVYMSNQSEGFAYIQNNTATLSGNNYTLGGVSAKYRCKVVPKIQCAVYPVDITASISETSLRHPTAGGILNNYSTDIRIEQDATNWYVCGGAYGGMIYDTSTFNVTTDASGNSILNYNYVPNNLSETYLYFTNQANASNSSYMIIRYKQICR